MGTASRDIELANNSPEEGAHDFPEPMAMVESLWRSSKMPNPPWRYPSPSLLLEGVPPSPTHSCDTFNGWAAIGSRRGHPAYGIVDHDPGAAFAGRKPSLDRCGLRGMSSAATSVGENVKGRGQRRTLLALFPPWTVTASMDPTKKT